MARCFPLPLRPVKLATWNVNSLAVRLPQVLDWLLAHPVDALVLQETKLTDDKFPLAEIEAAGYAVSFFGQKTYNGVALLTRDAHDDVLMNIPGFADDQARVITGTVGGIRVIGGYFPNGQAPDSDKFVYKMAWLDALRAFVASRVGAAPALGADGRLQHRPRRPRRLRPHRLGWPDSLHRCRGARSIPRASST